MNAPEDQACRYSLDMLETICKFLDTDISDLMKPDRDEEEVQPACSEPSPLSEHPSCCSGQERHEE